MRNRKRASDIVIALLMSASAAGAAVTTMASSAPTTNPTATAFDDYFSGASSGRRDRARDDLMKLATLSKDDVPRTTRNIWNAYRASPEAILRIAADQHGFAMSGDEPLHYVVKPTGARGPNGYAVFLDLHGGGEGAPEMNDGDWIVHQSRYTVPGKLVAIRAPRDTWDQFHNEYFHTFMDRVVEQMIVAEDADPNRIYLQGFSSGGYGVMQLAPTMPDRFAAAACNAAASEGSRPENLRDLPFVYRVGEHDTMYGRDKLARETGDALAALKKDDPAGYDYWFEMVPGKGHGFDDRPDGAWMAQRTRDPYPTKIVWWQNQPGRSSSNPVRHQMYWLAVEPDVKRDDSGMKKIVATRDGQTIALTVEGYAKVRVRLNDAMVDLDRPVKVTINGTIVADDLIVPRKAATLLTTFLERKDPTYAFPAELVLNVPQPTTRAASSSPLLPGEGPGERELADTQTQSSSEPRAVSVSASASTLSPNPSPGGRGEPDSSVAALMAAHAKPSLATQPMECCVVDMASARARAFATSQPTTSPISAERAYRDALAYSLATMPAFDVSTISVDLLNSNARLACEAASGAPWRDPLDPAMFRNYVLPYANFDEHRDDWRPRLYEQLHEEAWKQPTRLDAAKWINDHFAELFGVTYSATDRPKPDMSPFESFKAKHASCTGLSILLVDACRSAGIPARVVGVPAWTKTEGNHNWVEVWDGQWWSIGDSGTDPRGNDWIKDRAAAQTDPDCWQNSVYALCWRQTNTYFPEVWNTEQHALPALNVTRFYSQRLQYKLDVPGDADATIRVDWAGELLVSKRGHGTVELPLAGGSVFTITITYADGRVEKRDART